MTLLLPSYYDMPVSLLIVCGLPNAVYDLYRAKGHDQCEYSIHSVTSNSLFWLTRAYLRTSAMLTHQSRPRLSAKMRWFLICCRAVAGLISHNCAASLSRMVIYPSSITVRPQPCEPQHADRWLFHLPNSTVETVRDHILILSCNT